MFKYVKSAVAACGLLLASIANANAAYITDGDFSTPYGGSSFTTYSNGSSFGPWNVIGGNVDLIGGLWQSPTVGGGSVDMNGTTGGEITQTTTGTVGSFLLSFSLSGNIFSGLNNFGVHVSVGDAAQDFFFTAQPGQSTSDMKYITQTLAFNATGATNLSFTSLISGGNAGAVIGNVVITAVSAVPLPASVYTFVAALLAMAGFHQLRKNRATA